MPASVTNYAYNAANDLVTAGPATLTYDKNGNLTNDGTLAYSYDAAGRLISALGGAVNSLYSYDGDGRRVSQQVPAGTYQYGIDLLTGEVLSEAGPDGNIDYSYTGGSRDSEIGPAGQLFYLYDAFDNVMTVSGPTGNIVENYRYNPWGQLLMAFDVLGNKNKYKFGSDQTDPGTGLVYMGGARYYNPRTGRFIGPAGADRAGNSYAYAEGNPFARTAR
jgi:RHS repeat-associated protein